MIQRLSIASFLGLLIDHIEGRTGKRCYDDPDGKPSPFYSVQIVKSGPANTKTMYVDSYEVWIHCISKPVNPYSNAPVLELVRELEEAMTDDLFLPEPYDLIRQEHGGLQALKKDESGEGHAVVSYAFHVSYGFRCK